ncbi:MAG: TIGR02757 family protein [Campylobacterota bacterium]|nr:TIGR02757 family protein [Campylobacterota bacterium]
MNIKQLLDKEVEKRNCEDELCFEKPDPLFVAKRYKDEYISLICALFAYGNAGQIMKFLNTLDFSLLDQSEDCIQGALNEHYYRFQNSEDVIAFFIAIKRLKEKDSLESIFKAGYDKEQNVLEGIKCIIEAIQEVHDHYSDGYKFLIGKTPKLDKSGKIKYIGNSPYKRYNMFLRWMVRSDNIDMGLWKDVDKKDLILPLDTHTFKVGQKLGLLSRKTYDLKSAILITEKLKEFDLNDPMKYDFAIYRLGQEKIV